MTTIFIKDDLRSSVEAASGGKQTVLYTALGQPTFMNVIPQFNLQDIDSVVGTGIHPAFIVNGIAKSEIFIGTYQGIVKNGELLSLPGVDPSASANFDQFVAYARACGAGYHCITNVEFAALALWCKKNGFMPRGNNSYGQDVSATYETGRRQDGLAAGNTSGVARTLTGSGPASWRHDNTPNGISDLCGNIWEWTPGLRLNSGEINIIANNDASMSTTDHSAGSAQWKAIDGSSGALIAPGSANTVKIAATSSAAYTFGVASGSSIETMVNNNATPVVAAALNVLKAHGVYPANNATYPPTGALGGDGIWTTLTAEMLAIRGGDWYNAALGGVFALGLNGPRSYVGTDIGSRPAFVL
jgi:formylglycine-generating enzyme